MKRRGDGHEGIPWASFSDGLTALLFVFMALTVWGLSQVASAKAALEEQDRVKQEEIKKLTGAVEAQVGFVVALEDCLKLARTPTNTTPREDISQQPLAATTAGAAISVVRHENTLSLYVARASLFDDCSPEPTDQPQTKEIIDAIRKCTAEKPVPPSYRATIFIEGHSDPRPSCGKFPSNWELSGARASAMVRRLLCLPPTDAKLCDPDSDAAVTLRGWQRRGIAKIIAAGFGDSSAPTDAVCDQKDVQSSVARQFCAKDAKNQPVPPNEVHWSCLELDDRSCAAELGFLRRVDVRVEFHPFTPTVNP